VSTIVTECTNTTVVDGGVEEYVQSANSNFELPPLESHSEVPHDANEEEKLEEDSVPPHINFVAKLHSFNDIPRSRITDIINEVSKLLKSYYKC